MEAIVFIVESVFQFLQISDSKNTKDNNFKFLIFKTQNSQFSVILVENIFNCSNLSFKEAIVISTTTKK